MPHRELNDRFKTYQTRAKWARLAATSVFCVCLMVGVGLAFEIVVPPNSIARAVLSSTLAAVTNSLSALIEGAVGNVPDALASLATSATANLSDALAPIGNIPSQAHNQLAAVASLPWIDALANTFYDTVCPFFHSCPQTVSSAPAVVVRPQSARINVTIATTAPATSQQLPTHVASPSQPIQQTIVNQPVIERTKETVRTVVEGGADTAYVDARMQALQQSLQAQIAAVGAASHVESQTIYQTLGAVAQIDNLGDIHVTSSHWTGGNISGAAITGGTITDASISGYLPLSGGTLTGSLVGTDLTLSGNLTAGTLSVAGLASGGAVAAPYFSATSTSASSTFTNFNVTNATATNATSTNLFATAAHFATGVIDALTSAVATITNLTATTITATSATSTNEYSSNLAAAAARFGSTATSTFGTNGALTLASALSVSSGGTGWSAIQLGSIPYGNGSSALATTTAGTAGQVLALLNGIPTWVATSTLSSISGTLGISNGGTNATSLGSHMLLAFNGTSVVASSTPTAAAYLATSTTATSTFAGMLAVGSNALNVLSNGNVGIGTASPSAPLVVVGANGNIPILSLTSLYGTTDFQFTRNSTTGALSLQGLQTGNNNIVLAPTSGNVGIGTTSPNALLGLQGGIGVNSSQLYLAANGTVGIGTASPGYSLDVRGAGVGTNLLLNSNSSIQVADTRTAAANVGGGINFTGAYTGSTLTSFAGIRGVKANATAGNYDGQLEFFVRQNGDDDWTGDQRMVITAGGNIGIAQTSPTYKLDVTGLGHFTGLVDAANFVATSTSVASTFAGSVGIGTAAPSTNAILEARSAGSSAAPALSGSTQSGGLVMRLSMPSTNGVLDFGNNGSNGNWIQSVSSNDLSSNRVLMLNPNGGNVGIATTSPWRTLDVNGTVGFKGLTNDTADSKTLCLTANNEVVSNSGSTCITSSQRFKNSISSLDDASGLAEILKLDPVSFHYNDNVGIPGEQVGFIAEQVQQVDPRLVVLDASGTPFTVRYEQLTSILAKAVQQIVSISGAFRDALVAWLGSAQNGIDKIFAKEIIATNGQFENLAVSHQLCVNDDAGVPVCVTGTQLRSLLNGSVLGAHTESAAGAPGGNSGLSLGAPAAVPAREATPNADTGTTTTSSVADPVNDNAPAASTTPPAANDNPPPLSATGTEATSTP